MVNKAKPVDMLEDFANLHVDPLETVTAPGVKLRWVNKEHRDDIGWGIWHPVRRSAELGKRVIEQLSAHADNYYDRGKDVESDLIYHDAASVLAFAPNKQAKAYKAHLKKLADDQISVIKKDGAVKQTKTIIPIGT